MPFGLSVKLEKNVSGLIVTPKQAVKVGDKLECQVLDLNPATRIVDLKVMEKSDEAQTEESNMQEWMQQGVQLEAVVELSKDDYSVLSLKSGDICYSLNKPFNTITTGMSRFKAGQKVKVQIKSHGARWIVDTSSTDMGSHFLSSKRVLREPVDPSIKCLEDVIPGNRVKARVLTVKSTQLNLALADNLKARINIIDVFDTIDQIENQSNPLGHFKPNQILDCKVIGFHDMKTHKYLPFSHTGGPGSIVADLTIRPSELESESTELPRISCINHLEFNSPYLGFVQKVDKTALWVQLGQNVLGRVEALEASTLVSVLSDLKSNFWASQPVMCHVLRKDEESSLVDLSLIGRTEKLTVNNIQLGALLTGKISRVNPQRGVVYISSKLFGRVALTDIQDELCQDITESVKEGAFVKVRVVQVDQHKGQIGLSLKESDLTDFIETPQHYFQVGQVVQGFIKSISEKGCFVELSRSAYARVKIADLSDEFIKDWKSIYKLGQLVKGKILNVDEDKNQIEMTLKKSSFDPSLNKYTFENLEVGSKVDGVIRKIEKFGVFININDSRISGLCHISQVSDTPVSNIERLYNVGDHVRAYVLKVDRVKQKVSLSLKSSHFEDSDGDESMSEDENVMEVDAQEESHQQEDAEVAINKDNIHTASNAVHKALDISAFSWDGEASFFAPQQDSDSESEPEQVVQKSKRQKKKEKEAAEVKIREKEEALLDTDRAPELAEDYERLLVGSPNNSFLWIKYMAFQMGLAEVEKARQIAERALKTINFREEQEKLNIWVAYLNLENSFGSEETLAKIFERACQMNEAKAIYIQLAHIYERTEKPHVRSINLVG